MSGYNVKGITIEIGANATELSTALNNISRQYSGLDKQAQQLKRSIKLSGDDVSMDTLKVYGESLEDQLSKTRERLEATQKAIDTFDAQLEGWRNNVDTAKGNIESLNAELKGHQESLTSLVPEYAQCSVAIEDSKAKIDSLKTAIANVEGENRTATTVQQKYNKEIEQSRAKIAAAERTMNQCESSLRKLDEAYMNGKVTEEGLRKSTDKLIEAQIKAAETIDAEKEKLAQLAPEVKTINESKKLMMKHTADLVEELRKEEATLESNEIALQGMKDTVDELEGNVTKCKDAIERETTVLKTNQAKVENAEKSRQTLIATKQLDMEKETQLTRDIANNTKAMDVNRQAVKQLKKEMQDLAETTGKAAQRYDEYAQATRWLSMGAAAALGGSAAALISHEDAFTGITKTLDATPEQFEAIEKAARELATSTASSYEEIAKFGELGGQMGVDAENLAGFMEVVTKLSDTTNIVGEDAAQTLAQFANIMVDPENRTVDYYERLGSTIVDLGNNFATTEDDIMQMADRLGTAGRAAGLTSPEVLALATALSSVGIEAAAGGGSMSKLMTQITTAVGTGSEDLQMYAETAGMSAEDFAKAWEEDAGGAFMRFIQGIGEADNIAVKLQELGIEEVRLSNGVRALAQSTDVYADAMQTANKAYEENTAMTEEAERRYGTLKSQLIQTKETIKIAATELGEVLVPYIKVGAEKVKEFADWVSKLDDKGKKTVVTLLAMAAGISPFFKLLSKGNNLVKEGAKFIDRHAESIMKLGKVCTNASSKVGALGGGMVSLGNGLGVLLPGIPLLVAGIALAATKGKEFADGQVEMARAMDQNREHFDALVESARDYHTQADQLRESAKGTIEDYVGQEVKANMLMNTINRLNGVENLSEAQKVRLKEAVEQLKEVYPELDIQIDENSGHISGNTDEIRKNLEEFQKAARIKALTSAYEDQMSAAVQEQVAYEKSSEAYNNYLHSRTEAQDKYLESKALWEKALEEGDTRAAETFYEAMEISSAKSKYFSEQLDSIRPQLEGCGQAMLETNTTLLEYGHQLDKAAGDTSLFGESFTQQIDSIAQTAGEGGTKMIENLRSAMNTATAEQIPGFDAYVAELMTFQQCVDESGMWGGMIPQELVYSMLAQEPSISAARSRLSELIQFQDAVIESGMDGTEIATNLAQGILNGEYKSEEAIRKLRQGIKSETKGAGEDASNEIANSNMDTAAGEKAKDATDKFDKELTVNESAKTELSDTAGTIRSNLAVPQATTQLGASSTIHWQNAYNLTRHVQDQINQSRRMLQAFQNEAPQYNPKTPQSTPFTGTTRLASMAESAGRAISFEANLANATMGAVVVGMNQRMSRVEGALNSLANNSSLKTVEELLTTIANAQGASIYIDSRKVGELVAPSVRQTNAKYDRVQAMIRGES